MRRIFAFIILLAMLGTGCALKEKGYARMPDPNTLTSVDKVYTTGEPPSLAVSGGLSTGDQAVLESIGKMSEAQKEQTDILRQIASALKGEKEPAQEEVKKPEPGAFRKKEVKTAPKTEVNDMEERLATVEQKLDQKADKGYVDQEVAKAKRVNEAAIARLRAAINGGGSNCQTEKRIGRLEDRAGQDTKHYAFWTGGFEPGSSELTELQKTELDSLATTVRSENITITGIAGYSDTRGTEQTNKNLSLHRAEAVKAYLSSKGIDTKGVKIVAGGKTDSYGKCRKNNRVVAIFGERVVPPTPKPAAKKK